MPQLQYLLHPIVAYPQSKGLQTALKLATDAGYSGIVMVPFGPWPVEEIRAVPPEKVGAVEGAWHAATVANFWHLASLMRVAHLRDSSVPLPWDNLFWGDHDQVVAKEAVIQHCFSGCAIYSGHGPENTIGWPVERYAWEVNPDHGIYGDDVLEVPGKFGIDFLHLTRLSRIDPTKRIVAPDQMLAFIQELIKQRGTDIVLVHLHLAATQIVPFTLGLVPPELREGFRMLAQLGDLPVAVQFLPPFPLNWSYSTAVRYLRRIKEVADGLYLVGLRELKRAYAF